MMRVAEMRYSQDTITQRTWAAFWLFLLGASLGTALDALEVYSGVERYPRPMFFGVAWWVPLLFGAAAVAIGYSHPLISRTRPYRRLSSSIGELTWLVLAYLISASTLDSQAKVGLIAIIYELLAAGRTKLARSAVFFCHGCYRHACRDDPGKRRCLLVYSSRHTRRPLLAPRPLRLRLAGGRRPG